MTSSAPCAIDALKQTPHGLDPRSRTTRPPVTSIVSHVRTRCSRTSKPVEFVTEESSTYVASTRNPVPARSTVQLLDARAVWFDTGTGLGSTAVLARLPSG